jgi:hypothetical protein
VSLKGIIQAHQRELPVTMRMETWMTNNPNPKYSAKALEFAALQLDGVTGSSRLRKKMFRASAAGTCQRKQIFSILEMPKNEQIDSKLANIFATGNMLHLKWQLAGLTEGWLERAEVPVDRDDMNAGGTMDGILHTGGGFEFKTINSRGYSGVTMYGPKEMHLFQVHHYMLMGDLDHFSIVYENKDNGEWKEFYVERDSILIDDAKEHLERLNKYLEDEELPPPLDECVLKTGSNYRFCAFKDICLKPGKVF